MTFRFLETEGPGCDWAGAGADFLFLALDDVGSFAIGSSFLVILFFDVRGAGFLAGVFDVEAGADICVGAHMI